MIIPTSTVVALVVVLVTGCAEKAERPEPRATVPPGSPGVLSPPRPPAALTPRHEEDDRLKQLATDHIQQADRLLQDLDQTKLNPEQRETVFTIQRFLSKAKEALAKKDFLKASTLADKSLVLADELSRTK